MFDRILWAYIGTVGLPLFFLPFALINDINGEFLFYVLFFLMPVGMIMGLADHDSCQHIDNKHKLYRSLYAAVLISLSILGIVKLTEQFPTEFMRNKSWVLVPSIFPIFVAPLSNLLFKKKAGS